MICATLGMMPGGNNGDGDFLQRQGREQMLLQLNEVYAGGMESAEKHLLKGIKAKVRRAVKERARK
jgi:hypothetical protein